jgi:PAS domain S-box-containing protein
MILTYSYGLALLELTFVLVAILLLHRLKHAIGSGALYLSLGALMVMTQFITAAGLRLSISGQPTGLEISIGSAVFFTPFMAALLIIYIVDGTLETQRLMLGMLALLGIFTYIAFLTEKQIEFPIYQLSPDLPAAFLQTLFSGSRTYMLASLLSLLILFFALPVVYEILRSRNCRLGVSVVGALIFVEVLDAFFYELVIRFPAEDWWDGLRRTYLSRAFAMLWVSTLTTLYLKMRDAPRTHESSSRRPLDIVVAFLGAYGHAQRLNANVREWEGRYRMVVENSNDLIFLVSKDGMVLDANRMALETSGYFIDQLLKLRLPSFTRTESGQPFDWQRIWRQIYPNPDETSSEQRLHVAVHELHLTTRTGQDLVLDVVISPLILQETEGALLVARDITQRKKLESERQQLQEQLLHSQRMEAVGKLAGGIAHDFNNLLHAIQGSLDVLERNVRKDERSRQMVANIATATQRASTLTGQLLGFARGGKYHVERIELMNLVKQTEELFRPLLGKNVKLRVVLHPDPMLVEGDFTQLQQVLFNILLNAMEAMPEGEGRIIFRAEPATEFTPGWNSAWSERKPEQYVVIRIRDNGCGMTEEVKRRIFEPFFTTKLAKGTGMGLAMAYGCIENHNGWIFVETAEGVGTEFVVYLPRAH